MGGRPRVRMNAQGGDWGAPVASGGHLACILWCRHLACMPVLCRRDARTTSTPPRDSACILWCRHLACMPLLCRRDACTTIHCIVKPEGYEVGPRPLLQMRKFASGPHWRERSPDVLLVQQPHQRQVVRTLLPRFVVQARPRQPHQFALPHHGDLRMARLDPPPPLVNRPGPPFF